jgi:hypothetical protein
LAETVVNTVADTLKSHNRWQTERALFMAQIKDLNLELELLKKSRLLKLGHRIRSLLGRLH